MKLPWWLWERKAEPVQPGQRVSMPDGWLIERTTETDPGGNVHEVIRATRGEEVKRFSPNCTTDEVQAILVAGT